MTKFWKIDASKNGNAITLFTSTSDEQIATDLKLSPSGSLISLARHSQFPRGREATIEENHSNLAMGAFMAHRGCVIAPKTPLLKADAVPPRETSHWVGGDGQTFLMMIWEEPCCAADAYHAPENI